MPNTKKDDGERHIKCKYLMEVGRVLKGEYSGRVGLYNKGVGYWLSINALLTDCCFIY
jgi:hypothetical protein